jgi:cytidine deaminase
VPFVPFVVNKINVSTADLEQAARAAANNAYAPYSNFPVGAALQTADGTVFSGCNVENASFGLTNCAERTAVFKAIAAGHREITCVAIYTPTKTATAPCGACRQVLREFGKDMKVISTCDGTDRSETTLSTLLPDSFGPETLSAR